MLRAPGQTPALSGPQSINEPSGSPALEFVFAKRFYPTGISDLW